MSGNQLGMSLVMVVFYVTSALLIRIFDVPGDIAFFTGLIVGIARMAIEQAQKVTR